MSAVLALSGSPSPISRTASAAQATLALLEARGHTVDHIAVRELPAADLLGGNTAHPRIAGAQERIAQADGLIVATPIFKASYSGLLKSLLDLLPQKALAGKAVLPLATDGTPTHLLAVDYALRPVLSVLGARHIIEGTFLLDSAFTDRAAGSAHKHIPTPEAHTRLADALGSTPPTSSAPPKQLVVELPLEPHRAGRPAHDPRGSRVNHSVSWTHG
nr:NADPH-dependent FMN reductase [Streptomyces antibioticus]